MYTYSEFIEKTHSGNTGLAILIVVLMCIAGLLSISKPMRLWFEQIHAPALIPNLSLSIILLLALVLRLPSMFFDPWYDETFSSAVAHVGWQYLPSVIISDVHPPLPYLIQWSLIRWLGDSIMVLRLPSLIFGLISIYQIFIIARKCNLDLQTARLAALLLALLPVHINYSTEARQYALLTALVLWCLLSVLDNKPKRFLLAALLPFVHAQGFIYLAAFSLYVLPRSTWRATVFTAAAVGALWLPLAMVQSSDVSDGWWNPPLNVAGSLAYFVDTTLGRAYPIGAGLFVYAGTIPLTAVGLWLWIRCRQNRPVLWLYITIPLLTAAASILWGHNVFMGRSLLPAGCLIVILWAYALTTLGRQHVAQLLTGASLIVAVAVTVFGPHITWSDYLDCGSKPVFATSNHLAIMAQFYNPGETIFVRATGNDWTQHLTNDARAAMGFVPVDNPPLGACVIYQLSPLIGHEQQQYIANLLARTPHESHLYIQKDIYQLWVFNLYG